MNFILKIVQGPNAGAEIALVEGINVKLGKGDECDVVLADQTLPDVACELEVAAERVSLLLPDGTKEAMEPCHVKTLGTTAIAIGLAEGNWGALVWPETKSDKEDVEKTQEPDKPETPAKERKSNKLLIVFIVLLVLFVILELVLWLFWPFFNSGMVKVREVGRGLFSSSAKEKARLEEQPAYGSIEELAEAFNVEVLPLPNGEEGTLLKGNLEKSTDRLQLTAAAYSIMPGIAIDLSDNESLARASEELLNMLTAGALKVVSAKDRKLELAGKVKDADALRHILEAINNDVKHVENIDCSQVEIIPQVVENQPDVIAVAKKEHEEPHNSQPSEVAEVKAPEESKTVEAPVEEPKVEDAPPAPEPRPPVARLPIVGVVTMPYPYLVLRNGARVMEGGEFNGYVISKICDDVIILKNGDETLEWRP